MLDLYDVGGDRWTELVELAREAQQRGSWRAHGLLQTADYARALMRAVPVRRTPEHWTTRSQPGCTVRSG